jgi:hypothetical protein
MSRPWTVGDKRWTMDTENKGNSSLNQPMICIDRRTRASHPPQSPCAPVLATSHLRHLRHTLSVAPPGPGRSIATLPRTAVALIDVCVVLIGVVSIPLKRPRVVLVSGVILSVDMLPTGLVLLVQQLFAFRCCTIAPNSGGD